MAISLILDVEKPVTFLSVSNRSRAKMFYTEKLGLKIIYEDDFALALDLGVTSLRIAEVNEFQPQPFTVLGWEVSDIVASATALMSLDIKLKRYAGLDQDDLGIWRSPSTSVRVVWFEDPDGNMLSLSDPVGMPAATFSQQ